MKDILFLLGCLLAAYVLIRVLLKEPILFWKEKEESTTQTTKAKKNKKVSLEEEEEALPFRELFKNVKTINNHMIHFNKNQFILMAEVQPVNYFLLDPEEQEGIDSILETWKAMIDGDIRIYHQNRYIDLTDQIEIIQKNMNDEEDLGEDARLFGESMVEDLKKWQNSQPRYETKRYILFYHQVNAKDIRLHDGENLEDRIIEKAFSELHRKYSAAKNQLGKGEMEVELLTTDGICEVLYYAFNRKLALKNRYRDVEDKEKLALYVTADQTPEHIIRVKGELENAKKEEREANQNQEETQTVTS